MIELEPKESLKSRLLRGAHTLIYRYWVDPFQRAVPKLATPGTNWQRRVVLPGVLGAANLGRLAITDFRVGIKRWKGPHGTIVYVGAGFSFEELYHLLGPALSEVEDLGRNFLWNLPAVTRRFIAQGELVVCELNPIISWRPCGLYVFAVPRWIRQTLDLNRPLDDILAGMNQTMRRKVRKLEKEKFSYVFTQDLADFELFYHTMYRPYIKQRYGTRATLVDYQPLRQQFIQNGLILVKYDHQPICGMLCQIVGEKCVAGAMGVVEGEFGWVEKGSNVALWWFMLDWAHSKGLRQFDFGASRAHLANGVFNFKRQWGTKVVSQLDIETEWVFCGQNLPVALRYHLNKLSFISQAGDSFYRVVLLGVDHDLSAAELTAQQQEALAHGLNGLFLITPGAGKQSSFQIVAPLAGEA